jgi:hypothetical protein
MKARRAADKRKPKLPFKHKSRAELGAETFGRYERLTGMALDANVSHSGLSKLCEQIRQQGLPEHTSRASQYRGRKKICQQMTPFGKLVTEVDGDELAGKILKVPVQNPLAAFYVACTQSADFEEFMTRALARTPCEPDRPWHIVFYQDGVDPSDGLAKNHSRKSNVFYWSFLELGQDALSHEECWFSVTLLRWQTSKILKGQLAQAATHVLESMVATAGRNFRNGCTVPVGGHDTTIYAKIGCVIADEPGLKEVLSCKGHAGSKPCLLCKNCCQQQVGRKPKRDGPWKTEPYLASIAEPDVKKFKPHTDDSIRATVQRLHDYKGTMGKTAFAKREQALGFGWNPYSLILNATLAIGAASIVMYDWVHIYICDGLADVELGLCMRQLRALKSESSFGELATYLGRWRFPKRYGNSLVDNLFSEEKNKNNMSKGIFTSSASEFLTLAPVMLLYFRRVCSIRHAADDTIMKLVRSMIAVLVVVVWLNTVKYGQNDAAALEAIIAEHLNAFVDAYGRNKTRPKHHYSLHLADMLRSFGTLLGTLCNERKHRVVKRHTRNRDNLKKWDLGSLEEVTCNQIRELRRSFISTGQVQQSSVRRGEDLAILQDMHPGFAARDFTLSPQLRGRHGEARLGDVVMYNNSAGELQVGMLCLNYAAKGVEWTAVEAWELKTVSDGLETWTVKAAVVRIPSASVITPLTYLMPSVGSTSCVVLAPDASMLL